VALAGGVGADLVVVIPAELRVDIAVEVVGRAGAGQQAVAGVGRVERPADLGFGAAESEAAFG
jgi:hypothetical protein